MSEQELNIVVEHYENDELAAANEALADAYFSIRGENERVVAENAKLRRLASGMYGLLELYDKITGSNFACETKRPMIFGEDKSFKDVMCELGFDVG